MKTTFFEIKHCTVPQYWEVSWPGRGALSNSESFARIITWAFETGASEILLMDNYNHKSISYTADAYYQCTDFSTEAAAHVCRYLRNVDAICFVEESGDYAQRFVDIAEKNITWQMLKKTYTTTIGDLVP